MAAPSHAVAQADPRATMGRFSHLAGGGFAATYQNRRWRGLASHLDALAPRLVERGIYPGLSNSLVAVQPLPYTTVSRSSLFALVAAVIGT